MKKAELPSQRREIAERLKEARSMSGLSQEQAAVRLKLQRPTISEIESGRRRVSAEEIIQFAELYKVDSSWLLLEKKENDQMKMAARELSKLKPEEFEKLLEVLKILPK
jgi:transcriptional regulator with XRE-family HTH domain